MKGPNRKGPLVQQKISVKKDNNKIKLICAQIMY